MYSISEVAELSGVTTRTLRYYDSIDLLKPAIIKENGYRLYGQDEVDLLQQILFYKQFDLPLEEIKPLLSTDASIIAHSLSNHANKLIQQKEQLEQLITTLEKTIDYYKGEKDMTNEEKFDVFKQQKLNENQTLYGEELTNQYEEDTIKQYNNHWLGLSKENYDALQETESTLFKILNTLEEQQDTRVTSDLAHQAFECHKSWLQLASPMYSPTYHRQMLDMYLADDRFTAYYTKHISKNSLVLLKDIVYYYTSNK